jgi:hypothetical protein
MACPRTTGLGEPRFERRGLVRLVELLEVPVADNDALALREGAWILRCQRGQPLRRTSARRLQRCSGSARPACRSRMIVPSRPDARSPGPSGPDESVPTGGSCRSAASTAGDRWRSCQRISSLTTSGRSGAARLAASAAYAAAPRACAPMCATREPPGRRLARRPSPQASSHRELRHQRRIGVGSLRRLQARHEQRRASARWHHADGCPRALPPRTIPALAPRSPPPTRRRSAGQARSVSAENPHSESSQVLRCSGRPASAYSVPRSAPSARCCSAWCCCCRRRRRSSSSARQTSAPAACRRHRSNTVLLDAAIRTRQTRDRQARRCQKDNGNGPCGTTFELRRLAGLGESHVTGASSPGPTSSHERPAFTPNAERRAASRGRRCRSARRRAPG